MNNEIQGGTSNPQNTGFKRRFRPQNKNNNKHITVNQGQSQNPQGQTGQKRRFFNKGNNSQNSNNRNNGRRKYGNRNPNQNHGQRNSGFSRRQRFPDQMYSTANANDWNNLGDYKFGKFDGSKLRIIPISGVEMIGTNCTVLEYENDIMIIDAGLGFPEYDLTGIDSLVPNLSYVYDKLDKVRGLVITHGHTDHIGGLHQIYDKIGFPHIYAPKMAAEMIKEKFKETPFADRLNISEIDGESSYYLGKFKLSHFRMNHTIMDNYGICIDTPVGRVVTPSDYKFDLTPYKESPSDYSKLTKMGDEGILLLLDESTNIKKPGWSVSESAIARDLENVIRDAHGRLLIGMFSTMISRIRQIIEISVRYNKKIAIFGRSMDTNAKIAHRLGYIDATNSNLIRPEDIDKYPEDQIVVLTTGSQGEPNAALMRMAQDEHKYLKLRTSDTVVFSSSRIPGNEAKIDKLINMIAEKGCRVLTSDALTLHASGHGNQEDHKLMWELTKPKFLMPIHGEPSMLNASKELAMSLGFKGENVILVKDGSVIELWPDGWEITGQIESEPLWVEGDRVGDFDHEIIRERNIMTDEGVIVLNLKNFNSNQITLDDLELITQGFFIQRKDTFTKSELPQMIVEYVNRMNPNRDKESMKSNLRRFLENELQKKYEKAPLIIVSVL